MIGHRGALGHAPENTLASFAKADELGADLIECDVHFSSDRQLVVIHDESVDRTTNGFGLVRELSLEDLRLLDAGGGQRILTLQELLGWLVRRPRLGGIAIEIKGDLSIYPGISEAVVDAVRARGLVERSMVLSFDYAAVHEVKDLDRLIATGVLVGAPVSDPVSVAREVHADAFCPALPLVTPELREETARAGLGLVTWVANTSDEIRRALDSGADGIGTDYPDALRMAIDAAYGTRAPDLHRRRA